MNFNNKISAKLKLYKLMLILILLVLVKVQGQVTSTTASIPDPAFRQFLKQNYPNVIDADEKLIINNAYNIYTPFDCSNQEIQDLTGIEYFRNIYSLNCSYNQITFLPSLNSFSQNFYAIDCSHNQLTSIPNFDTYYQIRKIDCSFNKIKDLGSFNTVISIDTFFCNNNNLTFDDLIPIIQKHPAVFVYWPQASLPVDTKIELTEGSVYTLRFPSEDTASSTTFELFKKTFNWGGANIQNKLLSGNTFAIPQVLSSDTGTYFIQATNKMLPQLSLSTTEQRLVVTSNSENVFTPNGDNKNDNFFLQCGGIIHIYNRYGQQIKQIEGSDFWDGTDQEGYDAPIGTYIIRCADSNEIVVTLLR